MTDGHRLARVSVLMPVKEYHPVYLERALASVFAQSSPLWRLLVIGEKENVHAMTDTLRESLDDDRVSLVANGGRKLSGAINTGMRYAETDFTAILLGDDMWSLDAVEVLTSYIERFPDVDFFHSARVIVDENDDRISPVYPARETFTLEHFLDSSPVRHLLCWRKGTALAFGGLDETLNSVGPDDYDFPWLMAEHGARFMAVPDCLYFYRDHRDSFRLTTHLPMSVHTREIRRIFHKHGVARWRIERRLLLAKMTWLRQCIYLTPVDRWIKERCGYDAHRGYRQTYD